MDEEVAATVIPPHPANDWCTGCTANVDWSKETLEASRFVGAFLRCGCVGRSMKHGLNLASPCGCSGIYIQ